jgi:hypothetical protein
MRAHLWSSLAWVLLALVTAVAFAQERSPDPKHPWQAAAALAETIRQDALIAAARAQAGFPVADTAKRRQALDQLLQTTLAAEGYPRSQTTGHAATEAFWFALDEASLTFREQQRESIETLLANGLIDGPRAAQFVDSVRLERGQPQRYATALVRSGQGLAIAPTEQIESLEERRQKAGLLPMATWLAALESLHQQKVRWQGPPSAPVPVVPDGNARTSRNRITHRNQ